MARILTLCAAFGSFGVLGCSHPGTRVAETQLHHELAATAVTAAIEGQVSKVDVQLSSRSNTISAKDQSSALHALLAEIESACASDSSSDRLTVAAKTLASYELPEGMELDYFSLNPGHAVPVQRSPGGSQSEQVVYGSSLLPVAARTNPPRPDFDSLDVPVDMHAASSMVAYTTRDRSAQIQVDYAFVHYFKPHEEAADLSAFALPRGEGTCEIHRRLVDDRPETAAEVERLFWEHPRSSKVRLAKLTVTQVKADGRNAPEYTVLSHYGRK